MKTLDVVVPIYNEAEILPELNRRLIAALGGLDLEWRVIYVDDGSSDGSDALLESYAAADERIGVLALSRNFGQQAAIAAGLAAVDADAAVLLDGDLQDPPEVIPELVRRWREGHDVVYAVKHRRKEGPVKRALFSLFYAVLRRLSAVEIPANAGNFSLMDRTVVDLINAMPEHNRYVAGLRAYVGGRQIGVEFERAARYAGEPRQSPLKLLRMAFDAFVAYSEIPLRMATVLGFVVSITAFLVLVRVLWAKLVTGAAIAGWASVMTSVLFLGGIQLLSVGVIGEYIGRIYTETKRRPNWVVRSTRNLPGPSRIGAIPRGGALPETPQTGEPGAGSMSFAPPADA